MSDIKTTIIGNCSECGGPVVECFDEKTGAKYYQCLECSIKKYIDYGKTIDMSKKKKNDLMNILYDKNTTPTCPSWPLWPLYPLPNPIQTEPYKDPWPIITYSYTCSNN